MTRDDASVYVVDDDEAVRDALGVLLDSVGLKSHVFSSPQAFLEHYTPDISGCLVLDIRMPGMSGLELQQRLTEQNSLLPIIFITGHGDVPMAVEAMQKGAVDFVQKPFRDQELLDRINSALEKHAADLAMLKEVAEIRTRISALTKREKEVMDAVCKGSANKVIAMDLGVSQRTVEIHRARVMDKMSARSVAQLVRMMARIENSS